MKRVETDLLEIDDFAPLLDVGEGVFGDEDGLGHTLGVNLSVSLPSLCVGCVEHKPT